MLELIFLGLLIASAVPAILSLILHAMTPWRKSRVGRYLMLLMVVIASVLTMSALGFFFRGEGLHWFRVLQIAVFVGVPIVLWTQLWLQLSFVRKNKHQVEQELAETDTTRYTNRQN